ncbi:MAG: threonine synthase, partial [Chloroflexi bacterium]
MSFAKALRCRECGREYPLDPIFSCEFCFGPLEVAYDLDGIRAAVSRDSIAAGPATIWRYAPFLPCDPQYKVDLGTGYTPLIKADRLAKAIGLDTL